MGCALLEGCGFQVDCGNSLHVSNQLFLERVGVSRSQVAPTEPVQTLVLGEGRLCE